MDSGIDENARRLFEQAWQEGHAAAIESFLPATDDPRYLPTLEELVHVELELDWKSHRGQTGLLAAGDSAGPLIESYLQRFPALRDPAIMRRLIAQEYWARHRFGDHPDRQSYGSRFQDLDLSGLNWEDQSSQSSVTIPVRIGSAAALAPTAIVGYEIIEEIGRGGMGVVYKARQLSLNRIVAIKMVLGGSLASEEELHRFRTEAQAIASLQHPNIVQIHEIGQHKERAYITLEYVDGPTLAKKLDHKPQSPKSAARLMETLARAMEAVHAQGIIHRDLKPANVLMSRDGTPKITDFGLAKQLQQNEHDPQASLSGRVIGTPNYASPEQAAGRTSEITAATDVYALGSILYEMLAGRPPFQGTSPMSTMMQVLQQEPVPPSHLQPKLPRDLETICLKCLQKQPRRRYPSAAALADDLHRFSEGQPILARPVSAAERAWRWWARNPLLATMSAGAIASLLAVAVVSTVFSVRLHKTLAIVTAQRAAMQRISTNMALRHGLTLCRQNQVREGMLWMARGVQIAPPESADLRWAMRMNIAAWSAWIGPPQPRSVAGPVAAMTWSNDGQRVFTATPDGQIAIRNAAGGPAPQKPFTDCGSLNVIALSPDDRVLAGGGEGGTLYLWDTTTGQPIGSPREQGRAIRILRFSGDGNLLVSASADGVARLWNGRSGQPNGEMGLQAGTVAAVAFSPDGHHLAVAGGNDVAVLHTQAGQGIDLSPALTQIGNVTAISFRGNDKLVTWASDVSGRCACLEWDAATGRRLRKVFEFVGEPASSPGVAAFSPDGLLMLVKVGVSGKTFLLRVDSAEMIGSAMDHGELGAGQIMAFSRDGRIVVTVGVDNAVRIWETATAAQIGPPVQQDGPVRGVLISPDAKRLLIAGADNTAGIWDLAPAVSWPPFQKLDDSASRVVDQQMSPIVAVSPDGQTTATASADGTVRLANKATGATRAVIGPLAGAVLAMAFSPDGKLLLTGGADSRAIGAGGEARIWQTATGQPLGEPLRHRAAVRCVAFSPDSKLALTGSDDQTAQLWSVAVGCNIGPALQHPGPVEGVCFSTDSKQLRTICLAKPTRRATPSTQALDVESLSGTRPAAHDAPSGTARLTRTWPAPTPATDDAAALVAQVRSLTGLEFGPSDAVQHVREEDRR